VKKDEDREGLPAGSLLISTLLAASPFILLNVSLGDQAVISERNCGCPLEAYRWSTHLHSIRSHEKLTVGGMSFPDTDISRVLDEILPEHHGGGPTHYQLVEEEELGGLPSLRLLVHPEVGDVEPAAVAETFLEAIGSGNGAEKIMGLVLRDAHLLKVERSPPLATRSGKILHIHQRR